VTSGAISPPLTAPSVRPGAAASGRMGYSGRLGVGRSESGCRGTLRPLECKGSRPLGFPATTPGFILLFSRRCTRANAVPSWRRQPSSSSNFVGSYQPACRCASSSSMKRASCSTTACHSRDRVVETPLLWLDPTTERSEAARRRSRDRRRRFAIMLASFRTAPASTSETGAPRPALLRRDVL